MDEIAALDFSYNNKVNIHFFHNKRKIRQDISELCLDGDISSVRKYINDGGETFYYRVKIYEEIFWYGADLVRVPAITEHHLERISNQIKNILNQKK
jgi:hypothetical protein